jgi:hypothetical protein
MTDAARPKQLYADDLPAGFNSSGALNGRRNDGFTVTGRLHHDTSGFPRPPRSA